MRPRLFLSIISLFLCTAFSVKAQSQALQAVEYERLLFEGAGPVEANGALIGRARCLMELGRWEDALDALDRLRLYALDPAGMKDANYLKALCKYREGDYAGAVSVMDEGVGDSPEVLKLRVLSLAGSRRFEEAKELWPEASALLDKAPGKKSQVVAALLALIPPAGHLYTHADGGLAVAAASAASAAFWVWQALEGNWITAIVGGGLLLSETQWRRSVQAVPSKADEYNRKSMEKFLKELESVLEF